MVVRGSTCAAQMLDRLAQSRFVCFLLLAMQLLAFGSQHAPIQADSLRLHSTLVAL